MFVEPLLNRRTSDQSQGWIEVICGSMFSGKTEELIRRVNRVLIAEQPVQIFKPAIDVRYDEQHVVSHNRNQVESIPVKHSSEIPPLVENALTVAIDEAQFFDDGLPEVCDQLANQGIRVIVAGLDKDYLGNPFSPMPYLMSIAEFVTKVHAICVRCGSIASFSHRTTTSEAKVLLGETESYEPLCRQCYHGTKH
ncbi:MAG: thymidine kinase [Bacteroidota bacterium]